MKRCVFGFLCVVLLGGLVVFSGSTKVADAAAVASAYGDSVKTDKIRCGSTYEPDAGYAGEYIVRVRCYYDDSRSWPASTDVFDTASHASPKWLLSGMFASGFSCFNSTAHTTRVDMASGPQSAGDSLSGDSIPSYGLEIQYSVKESSAGACLSAFALFDSISRDISMGHYGGNDTVDHAEFAVGSMAEPTNGSGAWPSYPADWFPGGEEFVPPVIPFCGAEVTITDHDPTDVLIDGEVLEFVTEITPGQALNVEVQIPGTSVWHTIYHASSIGTGPFTTNVTADLPPPYDVNLTRVSAIAIRCYDQVYDLTRILYPGQAVEDSGDGYLRPCQVARWYWPAQQNVDAMDELSFSLVYSGILSPDAPSSTIDIEFTTWDEANEDGPPRYDTLTWAEVDSDIVLGTNTDFAVVAGYDGSVAQFVFRCTDYEGVDYSIQWTASYRLQNSSTPSEAGCQGSSGIGLRPSSWVPGLVRGVSCALQYLFIPSSEARTELLDDANEMSEKAPISYLTEVGTELTGSFGGAPSGVLAHEDDCLALMEDEPNMGDVNICPATLGASGSITPWRTAIGVLFWFGAGWALWERTRKLLTT